MSLLKDVLLLFYSLILFSSCLGPNNNSISYEISAIESGLKTPVVIKGEEDKGYDIRRRMDFYNVPGVSMTVFENSEIKWAKAYGIANSGNGKKVDTSTLFQAGSISKPIAALSVLKLVEEGKMDLDEDIRSYLSTWELPQSKFDSTKKVTLRRLLTHNAGITVHGFPGYSYNDQFPSINMVLNGKGNTPPIFIDTFPGDLWRYSGGGYTIIEKAVEDVSGLPFEEYMDENILKPMRLNNSTYFQPLPKKLNVQASAAFDSKGNLIEGLWHNYPEQAAAGLWTTPTDIAKYCIEMSKIYTEEKEGILSKKMIEEMFTMHENDWGLGPALEKKNEKLLFLHSGKNAGFSNQMVAFAESGTGVVIMTNGDRGTDLMTEIVRSVSDFHGWNLLESKIIEKIELSKEELIAKEGTYFLDTETNAMDEYLIEVSVRGDTLYVWNPNNGEENFLIATQKHEFIDINLGDEVVFSDDGSLENYGFLWNGRYQFIRKDSIR